MSGLEAKHAVLTLLGCGTIGSTSINLKNTIAPMRHSPGRSGDPSYSHWRLRRRQMTP